MVVSVPAAVRINLEPCSVFIHFSGFAKPRNIVLYSVSAPSDSQNLLLFTFSVENAAWSEGSGRTGVLEPDTPRKTMAGGREEWPRPEKHGLESLWVRF